MSNEDLEIETTGSQSPVRKIPAFPAKLFNTPDRFDHGNLGEYDFRFKDSDSRLDFESAANSQFPAAELFKINIGNSTEGSAFRRIDAGQASKQQSPDAYFSPGETMLTSNFKLEPQSRVLESFQHHVPMPTPLLLRRGQRSDGDHNFLDEKQTMSPDDIPDIVNQLIRKHGNTSGSIDQDSLFSEFPHPEANPIQGTELFHSSSSLFDDDGHSQQYHGPFSRREMNEDMGAVPLVHPTFSSSSMNQHHSYGGDYRGSHRHPVPPSEHDSGHPPIGVGGFDLTESLDSFPRSLTLSSRMAKALINQPLRQTYPIRAGSNPRSEQGQGSGPGASIWREIEMGSAAGGADFALPNFRGTGSAAPMPSFNQSNQSYIDEGLSSMGRMGGGGLNFRHDELDIDIDTDTSSINSDHTSTRYGRGSFDELRGHIGDDQFNTVREEFLPHYNAPSSSSTHGVYPGLDRDGGVFQDGDPFTDQFQQQRFYDQQNQSHMRHVMHQQHQDQHPYPRDQQHFQSHHQRHPPPYEHEAMVLGNSSRRPEYFQDSLPDRELQQYQHDIPMQDQAYVDQQKTHKQQIYWQQQQNSQQYQQQQQQQQQQQRHQYNTIQLQTRDNFGNEMDSHPSSSSMHGQHDMHSNGYFHQAPAPPSAPSSHPSFNSDQSYHQYSFQQQQHHQAQGLQQLDMNLVGKYVEHSRPGQRRSPDLMHHVGTGRERDRISPPSAPSLRVSPSSVRVSPSSSRWSPSSARVSPSSGDELPPPILHHSQQQPQQQSQLQQQQQQQPTFQALPSPAYRAHQPLPLHPPTQSMQITSQGPSPQSGAPSQAPTSVITAAKLLRQGQSRQFSELDSAPPQLTGASPRYQQLPQQQQQGTKVQRPGFVGGSDRDADRDRMLSSSFPPPSSASLGMPGAIRSEQKRDGVPPGHAQQPQLGPPGAGAGPGQGPTAGPGTGVGAQQNQQQSAGTQVTGGAGKARRPSGDSGMFTIISPSPSNGLPKRPHSSGSLGRDASTTSNPHVVPVTSMSDSTRANRQELVESPQSKTAYKEFYRQFRIKERESAVAARSYAEQALTWMPQKAKWRVKLELADMAKRKNDFEEARSLYKEVCTLQPLASQGWLEWSKMEDECGHTENSLVILKRGLKLNFNEALLTRAIKQQERLHDMDAARHMLSMLKRESIDRVWRAIFEGALLEARAGQFRVARQWLKYLMDQVPWYGPIYYEAYKLEEKCEHDAAAMDIISRGLRVLPRYGPLWSGLLRMVERRDVRMESRSWYSGIPPQLSRLRKESNRAIKSISRELVWKVHFELAQAEERAAENAATGVFNLSTRTLPQSRDHLLNHARVALVRSLLTCPSNLRWKVWLAGARLELSAGSLIKARKLLCKAFAEVPLKSRSHIYLECARVEEFAGNVAGARRILSRACKEVRGEWKVFLEATLLEARAGFMRRAVRTAEVALQYHSGTGRLWAILVQLCHRMEIYSPKKIKDKDARSERAKSVERVESSSEVASKANQEQETEDDLDEDRDLEMCFDFDEDVGGDLPSYPVQNKDDVLLRALLEVPKSGEVWCEGARCHMNPLLLHSFDLGVAQRNLCFAIQFTPQYGDTFIECLRLELLCQVLLPRVLTLLGLPIVPFIRRFLCTDCETDTADMLNDFRKLQAVCAIDAPIGVPAAEAERMRRRKIVQNLEAGVVDLPNIVEAMKLIEKSNLERRCMNADPNYGTAWFYCRSSPIDPPSSVLSAAQDLLVHELFASQAVYARAIFHYVYRSIDTSAGTVPVRAVSKRPSSAPQRRGPGPGPAASNSSPPRPPKLQQAAAPPPLSDVGSSEVDDAMGSLKRLDLGRSGAGSGSVTKPNDATKFVGNKSSISDVPLGQHGDSEMKALLCTQEDGRDQRFREDELMSDIHAVCRGKEDSKGKRQEGDDTASQSANWPAGIKPIALVDVRGTIFAVTDFVTALIGLNRLVFNRKLGAEDRRRVLFGSDQILP